MKGTTKTIVSKSPFELLGIPIVGSQISLSHTVKNGKAVLKCPRLDQTFATPNEAEKAAIEFAQKWIDDGKRDLNL